jgi:hypothetical protein
LDLTGTGCATTGCCGGVSGCGCGGGGRDDDVGDCDDDGGADGGGDGGGGGVGGGDGGDGGVGGVGGEDNNSGENDLNDSMAAVVAAAALAMASEIDRLDLSSRCVSGEIGELKEPLLPPMCLLNRCLMYIASAGDSGDELLFRPVILCSFICGMAGVKLNEFDLPSATRRFTNVNRMEKKLKKYLKYRPSLRHYCVSARFIDRWATAMVPLFFLGKLPNSVVQFIRKVIANKRNNPRIQQNRVNYDVNNNKKS